MPKEIIIKIQQDHFAAKIWNPDSSGKIVLGLHGWLDNANTFDYLAPFLKGIQLICIDAAGHGLSSHRPPRMQYHLLDYVKDIFDIADQLQLERFAVLGHSMGGAIASFMAGTFPERITHLACIEALGPIAFSATEAPSQLAKALQSMKKISNKKRPLIKTMEDAIRARMNGMMPVSESAARALVERGLQRVEGGYSWSTDPRLFFNSAYRLTEEQAQAFLSNIKSPSYLILGDNGLFKGREAWLKQRTDCIPQLQIQHLAGGHHLHLEDQAENVATLLNKFFIADPN